MHNVPHMTDYRRATEQDIPELVRLRISFLNEVMNVTDEGDEVRASMADYFKENLEIGDYVSWLATVDGAIVATGGIFFYRMPPNLVNVSGMRAYILNVYTLPAYRRQGIARCIFERVMREATDRGVRQLSLHATDEGRALYTEFGFVLKNNEMVWGTHI